MDSTLASLEDEVIAFAQQQTADLEALRSDLNALLDARRKAVESAATKLLQRVDELRTNSAAAQVSSSPAAMDVAVNVIERGMFSVGLGSGPLQFSVLFLTCKFPTLFPKECRTVPAGHST